MTAVPHWIAAAVFGLLEFLLLTSGLPDPGRWLACAALLSLYLMLIAALGR